MMAVVHPGQGRQGQYLQQFFTLSSPGSRSPCSYFIAGVSGYSMAHVAVLTPVRRSKELSQSVNVL